MHNEEIYLLCQLNGMIYFFIQGYTRVYEGVGSVDSNAQRNQIIKGFKLVLKALQDDCDVVRFDACEDVDIDELDSIIRSIKKRHPEYKDTSFISSAFASCFGSSSVKLLIVPPSLPSVAYSTSPFSMSANTVM